MLPCLPWSFLLGSLLDYWLYPVPYSYESQESLADNAASSPNVHAFVRDHSQRPHGPTLTMCCTMLAAPGYSPQRSARYPQSHFHPEPRTLKARRANTTAAGFGRPEGADHTGAPSGGTESPRKTHFRPAHFRDNCGPTGLCAKRVLQSSSRSQSHLRAATPSSGRGLSFGRNQQGTSRNP